MVKLSAESFFSGLGDVLGQQFNLAENKLHSLDIVKDGHVVKAGKLGEFADHFDQSAERSYTEEGWFKSDPFNPHPKQLEILYQQPDITILVKKRAFASLVENYRTDLMGVDERQFIRATKFLFQNKCKQISAYERLTKIQTIATEIGSVDYHLLPTLFAATDTLGFFLGPNSTSFNNFKSVVDRVRTITTLSNDSIYTNWITNPANVFRTDLGEGTGVIEFTTAFNVDTTVTTAFGGGQFNISFADPYRLMRITHNDIEQAIADATNAIYGNSFIQLGLDTLNQGIQRDKGDLNQLRAKRGASPIEFIVSPDTFLGKRVRAIIEGSGIDIQFDGSIFKVSIDPGYLRGGQIAGQDGLDSGRKLADATRFAKQAFGETAGRKIGNTINNIRDSIGDFENSITDITNSTNAQPGSEVALFSSIVRALFNQLQINKNSQTTTALHNDSTNALRKKLRLHYGGKLIIQPMDNVHIFVNSKTQIDNKILGGLQDTFSGAGFLSTANKALMNLQDFFHAGQDNSIEKALFVGKDFPNWLWLLMRNQFTTDKNGTQIFAGLVTTSSNSYAEGKFTTSVSGSDNAAYFDFGVVNFKPALNVWNGSLFDPITPFDIKFDSATGFQKEQVPPLLPENSKLFESVFIKYKAGIFVGKKPTLDNFVQDTDKTKNSDTRRVFYDPDGMIYKWKEGIGALVMFGNNYEDSPPANTSVAPLTTDPFAGQDVMNSLSLLITGEPYNFATFYKAASQFDNYGRDVATGDDPAVSYFRNLQSDLKQKNLLYGNFVPFKRLSMDTDTYKNILNNQIRASGFDNELNGLLAQKAEIQDRILYLRDLRTSASISTASSGDITSDLEDKVLALEFKIDAKKAQINQELNKINQPISLIGNDITLDPSSFTGNSSINKLSDTERLNRDLRRRSHYLTRRLSWKVRANEDMNFFIVDDSYDKDYDIQAFEKDFTEAQAFKSEYETVKAKIEKIRTYLDLEVFANTQGHIEVRPPQYNKMPSSVFYRMLRLKQEFGIQIYPQFLEDLFAHQIDNILARVEILEDEIRMFGLALCKNDDLELASFLSAQGQINAATPNGASFQFLSNDSGNISRTALTQALAPPPANTLGSIFNLGSPPSQSLSAFKSVETQSTINNILSNTARIDLLNTANTNVQDKSLNAILSNKATVTRSDAINARLEQKTGQRFDLKQLFPNSDKLLGQQAVSSQDLFKILGEVADRISERQRILKVAAAAIKNLQEGINLNQDKDHITSNLLTPGLLNNKAIPQAFDNLIEDENYDDYGPGSGHRYVLKNHHIKSITIKETAPPFTYVEVQGSFGDNFKYNLDPSLIGFQGGGNAQTTASAVDYDLWRQYGMRISQAISAPFLTNPQTQCAPFAVALLNKARKQVLSGTIDLVGNEFMQPGEVVYVEHQDMLFYVESVQHRFTYGSGFSTSLQVGYGHMPGEYIPTYLDTVGKALYKNRDITNYVSDRHGTVNNEEHVGTIVGSLSFSDTGPDSIMKGTFGIENQAVLRALLLAADAAFNVSGTQYTPILELRIFSATQSGYSEVSSMAESLAKEVLKFLGGDSDLFSGIKTPSIPAPSSLLKGAVQNQQIRIQQVDSDNPAEHRSPSSHAYSMARASLLKEAKTTATDQDAVDGVIYEHVVDCWIFFEKIATQNK